MKYKIIAFLGTVLLWTLLGVLMACVRGRYFDW